MGAFDDLIPSKNTGGTFDDLIPQKKTNAFSDLIPTKQEEIPLEPRLAREAKTPTTIEGIRAQANFTREQYAKAGYAPSTMAPVESKGGAAFGVYAIQGKERQQNIEKAKAEKKALEIPFEQIVNDPDTFNIANSMMKAVGKPVFDPTKESKEDFVNRFYSNRRFAEINTLFGNIPELIAMKNAGVDQKNALALGRDLYQRAGDAPNQWRAAADIAYAVITDPVNYFGGVFGKAASSGVVRTGFKSLATEPLNRKLEKEALSRLAKRTEVGVSAAVEGTAAGAANLIGQRTDIEQARIMGDEVPEISFGKTAAAAAFGSVLSGAVSAKATKAPTIKERGEIIREELVKRNITTANPTAPLTDTEQKIATALSKDFETVHSEYVKAYGKELMDEIDPGTALTQPKIREEFSKSAVRTALQLMKDSPDQFGWNPAKEQISDAIYRTFSQVDKIDDVALEAALNKAGLNAEQFAAMTKATVSSGARDMQVLSVAARLQNRLREIDPGFNKRIEELYGAKAGDTTPTGFFGILGSKAAATGRGVKRVERETLAIVTSGIDTLSRNIYGNTIGLGAKTMAQLLEGFNYAVDAALKAADGQKIATLQKSGADAFKESFRTGVYLFRNGLAEDVMERVLSSNPVLLSRMTNLTQDAEMQNISGFARWVQSLNSAMDNMSRRAAFASSLETQLNRVGIDLYKDVLPGNKDVPTSILKKAVDDSFKDTFAYSPNEFIKSYSSFEDAFEKAGAGFVKGVDKIPLSSAAIPFARFITNALAFQYKYSPIGFTGAAQYKSQASKLLAEGKIEAAQKVNREGNVKIAQGVIGSAALLWAIDYRSKNPHLNWGEIEVGNGTVDVRAVFPIAPVLAIAEGYVKGSKANWKEITESVFGFKIPAGSSNSFISGIFDFFESEEKASSVKETVGKMVGDFVGRVTQPFVTKQVFDLIDLIRGDEAMKARDPNVTTAETDVGRATELAVQRVQAKLPVVKESLPPAIVRFEEQPTPIKEGEFFNRLVGIRTIPERTEAEKEIIKYGTNLYKVFGKPSGDKDFDRLFINNVNKFAIEFVDEIITRPDYKGGLSEEKKTMIDNALSKAVEIAKQETEDQFAQDFPDKLSRIEYLRLSAEKKRIVNQRYARDHGGRTMEEDKAYDKLPEYSDFGAQQFAIGGMVQQMNRLFGK